MNEFFKVPDNCHSIELLNLICFLFEFLNFSHINTFIFACLQFQIKPNNFHMSMNNNKVLYHCIIIIRFRFGSLNHSFIYSRNRKLKTFESISTFGFNHHPFLHISSRTTEFILSFFLKWIYFNVENIINEHHIHTYTIIHP